MLNARIVALMIMLIAFTPAIADSWRPWQDQRIVSPNGKYYVVMKRTGGPKVYGEWGPVEYTLCRCAVNTQPIEPAQSIITMLESELDLRRGEYPYEITPNPSVSVREVDEVLGRGKLPRPPLHILISNNGLGFAGIDVYGFNYAHSQAGLKADNAVVIVSSTGKVLHRKRLVDLFTGNELARFKTTAGGMSWVYYSNPGWINDAARQLAIVAATEEQRPQRCLLRFIDWDTGAVTRDPALHTQERINALKREDLDKYRLNHDS